MEKFGNLLIFCIKHNRPKKVVLCPSTLKTSLFRLQKHFCIFPKGLVYGFAEKCEFSSFYVFFFSKIGKINMPCNLLHRKLVFLDYENTDLKKWKNLHFSKGVGPWFWSKMWIFFHFMALRQMGHNKVSCDLLLRKLVFLDHKNTD